jgi:death-on-curing protein
LRSINNIKTLEIRDLLVIHYIIVDIFFDENKEGFSKGIKNPELLESALFACSQTFDGVDLWPDLFSKAACLFRSLVQNHAFHDGNKRTALIATIIFLSENGYYLYYQEHNELVSFALRVAKHKQVQVETIKKWIKKRAKKTITKVDNDKNAWSFIKGFRSLVRLLEERAKALENKKSE